LTIRLPDTYLQSMNQLPFYRRPLSYRFYNATLALIIINVAMYLLMMLVPRMFGYLALTPVLVVRHRFIWQVVTYMFLHGGVWHILINMLVLFIFGSRLEHRLGSSEFLLYYFITGVGAGIATVAVNWYTGMAMIPVVGASGAIFGVMLAFATFFPDTTIFVNFFIPLPARIAVLVFTGIEIVSLIIRPGSPVAHLTHLAGFVFGYLYFLIRLGINPITVLIRRR
jgi:membrane associated rhomboid family serine protease